jgi:hypothetical protein
MNITMNLRPSRLFASLLLASTFSGTVRADEVADDIKAALAAYEKGDLSEATTLLSQANSAIAEKKGGEMGKALPDAIGEWKAGELTNESIAIVGGQQSKRDYTKGDKSANITLMADSPMLGQFIGMMGNPQMAMAMGLKTRKVGDQRAIYNDKEGSMTMIVNSRFMIQINGSELDEASLMELAKGVDVAALAAMK